MVEHSVPALEVVLVFITIYLHIYFYFFIENCPKLRACIPNFGHVYIDLLLSAEVAFLQRNIGHKYLF